MSRFLRLALVASTAAAALSRTTAPAHAAPTAPDGCDIQFVAVGAMSTCAPGSVDTHQLELVCWIFRTSSQRVRLGPEVPTFLPSIALCPILGYAAPNAANTRCTPERTRPGCSRPVQPASDLRK